MRKQKRFGHIIFMIAVLGFLGYYDYSNSVDVVMAAETVQTVAPDALYLPLITNTDSSGNETSDVDSSDATSANSAISAAAGIDWGNGSLPNEQIDNPQKDGIDKDLPQISRAQAAAYKQFLDSRYTKEETVSTFQTAAGEMVDCVKIEAQPALKRAGMKEHQIQYQPTNLPIALESDNKAGAERMPQATAAEPFLADNQSCAKGSVPILRLTFDHLRRFENLDAFRQKYPTNARSTRDGPTNLHQYAVASRFIYNLGLESDLNLWKPYLESPSEFSLSQIWAIRGVGNERETVEAGWQKYRGKYGDWESHLFIYFTPDNYGSGGCYNLDCEAFVQIDNSVVIGGQIPSSSISTKGGEQYYSRLFLYKDGTAGDWWFQYQGKWVGYYPRSLFDSSGLSDHAYRIDYGGEIIDRQPDGRHTRTDMGSGESASRGWQQAAFQKRLHYVDLAGVQQRAINLNRSATDANCYSIEMHSTTDDNWREYFYFGGTGYNNNCQ